MVRWQLETRIKVQPLCHSPDNIELGATRHFACHASWTTCLSFSAASKKAMPQDDNAIGHSMWRGAGEIEGSAQRSKEPGDLVATHQGSQGKQCGVGRYGWKDSAILGQMSVAIAVLDTATTSNVRQTGGASRRKCYGHLVRYGFAHGSRKVVRWKMASFFFAHGKHAAMFLPRRDR